MNIVILKGNLTRDVGLSFLPSQTPVSEFGMAVNERRKQGDDWVDVAHFFDCKMFGKRAETVSKHFKKGDPILISGKLSYESWEKDGKKFSRVKVIVNDFEFLGKPGNAKQEPEQHGEAPYGDSQDEDIPF